MLQLFLHDSNSAGFATQDLIFDKSAGFGLNIFLQPKYFLGTRFPGSTTFCRSVGQGGKVARWPKESVHFLCLVINKVKSAMKASVLHLLFLLFVCTVRVFLHVHVHYSSTMK